MKITFRAEDNVDIVKTIVYNGSFSESDLPQIQEKRWLLCSLAGGSGWKTNDGK